MARLDPRFRGDATQPARVRALLSRSSPGWPAFAGHDSSLTKAASASATAVFFQPRHDLDEVAGLMTVIELLFQDSVPAIFDRTGRSGKRKQIGALAHTRAGARLDRRGADLVITDAVEDGGEAINLFFDDAA